jgi:hypothetical protein
MKRLLSIITGVGLLIFGLLGVLVSIVAIIDPVGTKMADNGDPFGTPPTSVESLLRLVCFLALTAVGAWLALRGRRRGQPEHSNSVRAV